jgi:hypothetical protein
MDTVGRITMDDGSQIFVEMEQLDQPAFVSARNANLPPGAEPCGAVDYVVDTMRALKGTLGSIAGSVHSSFKESSPDEWGIELNIGFKGTTSPIPVIVKGEANCSIKVHAKWKKAAAGAES